MENIKSQEKSEQQHFDALAEKYDANYGYNNRFFLYKKGKKIRPLIENIKRLNLSRPQILELGCGTGEYTKDLAELIPQSKIVGVDISSHILRLAKSKCRRLKNINFRVASAYSLPFPSKKFDVVCGFYVAHHLNLKKMFSEVNRVLKPGGLAYFVEPNLLNPIVYIIKNTPSLKKMVGDSPSETAINPLKLSEFLPESLQIKSLIYSEFVPAFSFVSFTAMIFLDKVSSQAASMPGLRYIGGTIIIILDKK